MYFPKMHPPWILLTFSITITILINPVSTSTGDSTPFFSKCWRSCLNANCTSNGELYKLELEHKQPLINKLLFWKCTDECQYECMWKTVHAFEDRNWDTPQFFGKWPFLRVLGMQEIGSVIGSILNLVSHIVNYVTLKRHVYHNHPLFWLWRVFTMVCANAWVWSTIFHIRDTYYTEFMDYTCAFSMVVIVFYCFGMRVLNGKPRLWGITFTGLCVLYFINHVFYLYTQKIDYRYNMIANIVAGMLGGFGWLIWCSVQWWRGRRYVWRCMAFVLLTGASMLLELRDFPPMFHFWDAHAIWHLSTAPLPFLFYRFIIDDCRFTRKRMEK